MNLSIIDLVNLENLGTALVKCDSVGELVSALIGRGESVGLHRELRRMVGGAIETDCARIIGHRLAGPVKHRDVKSDGSSWAPKKWGALIRNDVAAAGVTDTFTVASLAAKTFPTGM